MRYSCNGREADAVVSYRGIGINITIFSNQLHILWSLCMITGIL